MTREEARQGLQGYSVLIANGTELKEALNMAIEALTHDCDSCIYNVCNYNSVPWESNGELISRQDAISAVENTSIPFCTFGKKSREYNALKRDAVYAIKALPSAEPVHGEWLPCDNKGFFLTEVQRKLQKNSRSIWYGFKCSNCGFIYKGNALTESEFCQNCGAKMLTKESPENLSLKADGEVVSKGGE